MDSVRLAEILNYRLREHLGASVDYLAYLLPNELAIQVVMWQPAYLTGFTFTFREGERLPPEITGQVVRYQPPHLPIPHLPIPLITEEVRFNPVGNPAFYTVPAMDVTVAHTNEIRLIPRAELEVSPMANVPTNVTTERQVRTVEQEARYRELEARAVDEVFDTPTLVEYQGLRGMTPNPTPQPPRVRVSVRRDADGDWVISVRVGAIAKELPKAAVIKALLPPSDKHFIPPRQGRYTSTATILSIALAAGLSAQSLHDALRAWVVATQNQVTEANSTFPLQGIEQEQVNLLRAQPATLEVGGLVYKLVPCHQTDVRPLIKRVRERALAAAGVEANATRERAVTDARITVTEAERTAASLRAEAEAAMRRAGARVPDWVRDNGLPHYYRDGHWYVRMQVSCYIEDIRLYVQEWGTTLHWNPIYPKGIEWYRNKRINLWFRLGTVRGEYDSHSISCKVQDSGYTTPHIANYMCMELQGLPPKVDSYDSLLQLASVVSRGMRVVNLNSPLSREVNCYYPEIREQLPPVPFMHLRSEIAISPGRTSMADYRRLQPSITWDRTETVAEESSGTFSEDNVVPLAIQVEETRRQMAEQLVVEGEENA